MPLVYGIALATPGNSTTSGTANTEVAVFDVTPGVRNVGLQSFLVTGKGAGLTALSGISFRFAKFGTASTGGTAITPAPVDPGMEAAKAASASGQTLGSTRINLLVVGCGAASLGGWVAPNQDSVLNLQGSGTNSLDCISVSGTASLAFEWSGQIIE